MTPRTLKTFLTDGRIPSEIFVDEGKRAEWLRDACTTSMELDLLNELNAVFEGMLNAKSWDEFVELRGAYKAFDAMLDIPGKVSTAGGPIPTTSPAKVIQTQEQLQEFHHEQSCS